MLAALKSVMKWLVYAGLVAFAVGLMLVGKVDIVLVERLSLRINDAAIPVLDVLSRPVDAMIAGLARVRSWTDLAEENARLREDRERLFRWQAVAQRLEIENTELRRLINMAPEPQRSLVSARVVADSMGVFAQSLLLNAGSYAGVERNQVVLSGEGLVGRIIGVSERASRVLLITDINSRIPVSVGPSRVRAVLAGDNTDRPRLVHVVPGEPIRVGDQVVTSGIAGVLPSGLPIGTVELADDDRLAVRTHVDRARLEYVRVVDYGVGEMHVDPPMAALRHAASKRLTGQPDMHAAAQ
jgi:rod shape-determining protein MreC